MTKTLAAALAAAALALVANEARAHDTWLAAQAREGTTVLSLATGIRFPRGEIVPPPASIARSGCRDASGAEHPMAALHPPGALSCLVQLIPFDIELTPALVDVYLREIHPPATVRADWDAMRLAGKGWHERYVKFARIELAGDTTPEQRRVLRAPTADAPLEIVATGSGALRAGADAVFQVLARGQPQAGIAVELVSDRSPLGIWLRSDDEGLLRITLPFAADWLLRTTVLDRAGDAWNSRFATFAFTAGDAYAAPARVDSKPLAAAGLAARP